MYGAGSKYGRNIIGGAIAKLREGKNHPRRSSVSDFNKGLPIDADQNIYHNRCISL